MSFRKNRTKDKPVKVAVAKDSQSTDKNKQAAPPQETSAQDADRGATTQPQSESAESEETEDDEETEKAEEDDEPSDIVVPDGTSREVLDWVGDDKKRAQAALDKEQANERPRSGLTSDLQQIVGSG